MPNMETAEAKAAGSEPDFYMVITRMKASTTEEQRREILAETQPEKQDWLPCNSYLQSKSRKIRRCC